MVQLYARSGDEALVNSVTQSFQQVPKITRLNSGGYVVVWTGSDTDNSGVKAQIYDADGLKVGGEFQVNITSTLGPQRVESVAATPNGGFVAVYASTNEQIRAQRFDSSGTAVGNELSVAALNSNHMNRDASVTVLTNGVMIVTWMKVDFIPGPNAGQHIFAKAFNAATGVALSGEFRIDSSGVTGAVQSTPSVTALASGGWVATWVNAVGFDTDIVGQVFAANGTKVGGEFAVNANLLGHQTTPSITALAGGGFAIAWTDGLFVHALNNSLDSGTTPDTFVKVQLFTDAGVKVGGEIVVNSANDGHQGLPTIDDLPNGGFVVSWSDRSLSRGDQDGYAVMARVFDSSGAPVGNQFLVNTVTAGNQEAPAVTGLASGGFAVAWHGAGFDSDIRAQLFAPSAAGPGDIALSQASVRETSIGNYAVASLTDNGGVNGGSTYTLLADSTGGGFRIDGDKLVVADNSRLDYETASSASLTIRVTDLNGNSHDEILNVAITDVADEHRYRAGADFDAATSVKGDQSQAAIGALASGGYVVTWVDSGGDGGDGSGAAVKAQLFDPAGVKVGGELLVNTATANAQKDPNVTGLAGGGFVVLWEDSSVSGGDVSEAAVRGQRFDSAGAKVGGEFLVNTSTNASQIQPAAAALSSGGFVVTWTDHSVADQFGTGDIRAQIYDGIGNKVGGEILANTTTHANQYRPAVAATATGGFVLTWFSGQSLLAQRFDSAGNKLAGEISVVGPTGLAGLADPAIAVLASGNFVISWSIGFAVQAQLFGADGAKIGGAFTVDSQNVGAQIAPAISALPWGGFVISWEDQSQQSGDSAAKAVRAQMFDSAAARVGDEFVVNAGTFGDQHAPVSTVLASGGFVVGWTEGYFEGVTPRTAIEGRIFSLTVLDKSGNDILIGDSGANTLDGEGGNDQLYGLGGTDQLIGGQGADMLDGGLGADMMAGGTDNDIYVVDDAGDAVTENSGEGTDEIRTGLAAFSLAGLPNVENLTGTSSSGQALTGNGAANIVNGGSGNDFIFLQSGGDDDASGNQGNDVFLFGSSMNSLDQVDGGDGLDQVVLQGNYAGGTALTLGGNVSLIENLAILAGSDTRFGDPGTNFYDYEIAVLNEALAAGIQLVVDANRLRPGEDLTFDGSAETDGSFFIFGGNGNDHLTGGAKNDVFIFGGQGQWGSGDVVIGGAGIDQLALRGNYTIAFGAGQLIGVEAIGMVSAQDTRYGALGSSYSYDLTMADANVDSFQMTVDAAPLRPGETLAFNGSAEDDGSFRVFGGRGADTITGSQNGDILVGNAGADMLTGGGGGDSFRYVATTDSTTGAVDRILDFTPGTDSIDLSRIDADTNVDGNQAFRWIGSDGFHGNGSAGELRAYQSGASWFVEGDTNGDGTADLVIEIVGLAPLDQTHFML